MTIRKGQPWGEQRPLPPDGIVVTSDADARRIVEAARRRGAHPPVIGLLGGDLCRTLGGRGDEVRLRSTEAMTFPVDVGAVVVDGEQQHWFVAHLVAHTRSWRHIYAAMNAEWYRGMDLGPRAHPDDGVLDTYVARLRLSDLPAVRARARRGSHLPHPRIQERRSRTTEVVFDRRLALELDDELIGHVRPLELVVEPDGLEVVV